MNVCILHYFISFAIRQLKSVNSYSKSHTPLLTYIILRMHDVMLHPVQLFSIVVMFVPFNEKRLAP